MSGNQLLARSAQHRDYYQRNREKILERKRNYYAANSERCRAAAAQYKASIREAENAMSQIQ